MSYQREGTTVEKPFRLRALDRCWKALKFVIYAERGYPDRIVLKGLADAVRRYRELSPLLLTDAAAEREVRELLALIIEFAELKSKDGEPPPDHQLRRHKELRALGFKVSVLSSREEVERWYADRR